MICLLGNADAYQYTDPDQETGDLVSYDLPADFSCPGL